MTPRKRPGPATPAEGRHLDRDLKRFQEMILAATARIGDGYFQLPVATADAVYRERVYCYELYHQLRCYWGDFAYSLGGEVDKSGHPYFRGGQYAQAKPDFLVHAPGKMDRNLVCVEVKVAGRPGKDFADDLKKLTWFCRAAHYHGGIFLVCGKCDGAGDVVSLQGKVLRVSADAHDIDMNRIQVFYQPDATIRAQRVEMEA